MIPLNTIDNHYHMMINGLIRDIENRIREDESLDDRLIDLEIYDEEVYR